jgi:hypothetical protein
MQLRLYEIADDYRRALEQLADEPDREKAGQIMESIAGALQDKGANVALFLRNEEADIAAIEHEQERLARLREWKLNRVERLRNYLAFNMKRCGMPEINHPLFRIRFKKNPPAVDVLCEAQIPPEFWTQPEPPAPRLDKQAIAKAIKAGQDVPGATLVQSERLVID